MGETWFHWYKQYTAKQESPENFHLWTGIGVLLTALKGQVWIDVGTDRIFPNEYIVLVAGSAVCRKSSALGMGRAVLLDLAVPPRTYAQKITPEALVLYLHECEGKAFIYAPEFSVFLGPEAGKSGLLPILTDLYDCPRKGRWSYQTVKRGNFVIGHDICINMLAASTPEWLRDTIPTGAIAGGFTSRILFVYGEAPRFRCAFPEFTEKELEAKDKVVDWLNKLADVKGPVTLTDEAKAVYSSWYQSIISTSSELDGYFGRKHTHVLKISLALAFGESRERIVNDTHIRTAIALLEDIERHMPTAMREIGTSDTGVHADYVLHHIRGSKEPLSHAHLMKKVWRKLDAQRLQAVVSTLHEGGLIEIIEQGRGRYYQAKRD